MDSFKMVFTLFAFCFIAALLLAYVDKKTFPVRMKLNYINEMRARKEVLFMKEGGLNTANFPNGKYTSVLNAGKNEADFSVQNGEIQYTKLLINGKDYIKEKIEYIKKHKNENGKYSDAFVILRSFNENKSINKKDTIHGKKVDMDRGKIFLKKNPKFVPMLVDVLMYPVKYKELQAIEILIGGKKQQVLIASDWEKTGIKEIQVSTVKTKIGKTDISFKIDDGIASFLKLADKNALSGQSYKLFSDEELSINDFNEYTVNKYFIAYYGDKSIGTVYKIAPICFADKVVTIIGINSQNVITGIKILQQAETPGLGARILEVKKGEVEPWWQAVFHGLKPSQLYLKSKDVKKGKVDVITAATITPRMLTRAIRKSVDKYIELKETIDGGKN